jgi:hypothetical protein
MTANPQGVFVDFYLEFAAKTASGTVSGLSNHDQALAILQEARRQIAAGHPGAAVIYSANEGQTRDLARVYAAGGFSAGIRGVHQAEVMVEMEALLATDPWQDLRNKARIAPITTIPDQSDPKVVILRDMQVIRDYLDQGWAILGWMNQKSRGTPSPYAVGGGVVQLDPAIDTLIQDGLKTFAADFPQTAGSTV